jgi:hypothetical protein
LGDIVYACLLSQVESMSLNFLTLQSWILANDYRFSITERTSALFITENIDVSFKIILYEAVCSFYGASHSWCLPLFGPSHFTLRGTAGFIRFDKGKE